MKNYFSLIFLFLIFSISGNSFAVEPVYKYSCDAGLGFGSFGKCADPNYIFDDPGTAAQSAVKGVKAFFQDIHKERFVNFSSQYPECSYWDPNSPTYYVLRCTFNYNLTYTDLENNTVETGWTPFWVFVAREHPCDFNVSLKGTVGAVITSEQNGQKYVLSQNPGEPACVSSCSYNVDKQKNAF